MTIKVDVPAQEYLSLIELGEVLQELVCTIGEQKQGIIIPVRWCITFSIFSC